MKVGGDSFLLSFLFGDQRSLIFSMYEVAAVAKRKGA